MSGVVHDRAYLVYLPLNVTTACKSSNHISRRIALSGRLTSLASRPRRATSSNTHRQDWGASLYISESNVSTDGNRYEKSPPDATYWRLNALRGGSPFRCPRKTRVGRNYILPRVLPAGYEVSMVNRFLLTSASPIAKVQLARDEVD